MFYKKIIIIFSLLIISFWSSLVFANTRSIHIIVSLADNESQGIVKIPSKLGDGNDPKNNLYWGALYGIKTYLKKDKNWNLISCERNISSYILERCFFEDKLKKVKIVADAYKGTSIKKSIIDFLSFANGENQLLGKSDLIAYVGHNGLMDFSIQNKFSLNKSPKPDSVILACYSRSYFEEILNDFGSKQVVLTNGLLAPEGYVLDSIMKSWISNAFGKKIIDNVARAYHKYQKSGLNGARRLFYTSVP